MKSQLLRTKSTNASHAQPRGSRSKKTCIKSTTQKDSIALSHDSNAGNTHTHTHTLGMQNDSHGRTHAFPITTQIPKFIDIFVRDIALTAHVLKIQSGFQCNAHRSHANCECMFLTRRASVIFF